MKKKNKQKDDEVLIHLVASNKDLDKNRSEDVKEAITEYKAQKKLVFSETGELIVVETDKQPENSVVVDQIYKDGFFCLN